MWSTALQAKTTSPPTRPADRMCRMPAPLPAHAGGADRTRLCRLQGEPVQALDQVQHAAGVPPLVVVPGDHLDEVPPQHLGGWSVEDRRVRTADDVRRHDGRLRVLEDAA